LSKNIQHSQVRCPQVSDDDYVAHLFVIRCNDRDGLRRHLNALGVGTDIHYPVPDHKQGALQTLRSWPNLPVTEQLAEQVLTLPCFPEMTSAELELIVAAVNSWD
jgi:dTDP-4-amino-4,6-dideoxygalactose transaminase